jgi:hypothetical protein
MTVTGQANSTGAFSIAADVDDCSGGAGGGIGRPGSGLVVDFVASIARSSEESDSGGSSSGGSGGGSRSASATGPASSGTSGTVPAGQDNEIVVTLVNREDAAASFGIDISEVKLVFENVNAAGSVNVAAASVEEVSNLFDDSEGGLATTEIDDSEYSAIGEVFEIRASSELTFDGFIDVTIPFDESQIGSIDGDSGEGDVRFLHHNGMAWEDVTTGINTTANTVTGRMSGFSPVVAAVIDDGTFGSAYFENNPLAKMSVIEPVITDGIIPDPLQSVAVGQEVTISATVKNAQRAEQPYIFIIEVFSPTGHVESVMIESAELGHGETSMMSAKWKAAENLAAGIYEIKILVLSSFDQPYILADVASSKLEVLVDQQT